MDKTLILNKLISYYGYQSDADFARFLDIKPQVLSNWKSRNTYDIETLYTKCVDISAEWLITGAGEMKRSIGQVSEPAEVYRLQTDKIYSGQSVPLYNIEASAGIVTLFRDTAQHTPIDHIQIPNLPKCDGALYVNGDSMYPLLKSGDIVMYKQHDINDGILWGQMYLISYEHSGDDITAVKYIKKSDRGTDFIKLVSQNQHHEDTDVNLKKVRALALIKASIRINSMS